jgi:D-alanyl-lipoteichoic acid acyltransferase DltB (MBOAT superfamily)
MASPSVSTDQGLGVLHSRTALALVCFWGLLGAFKYFNFFVGSVGAVLTSFGLPAPRVVLDVGLPVGISFYTFQSMSYTIDIYRGRIIYFQF